MAQFIDKLLTLFGRDGATSNFEQFGSTVNGGKVATKDVETIQALSAWVTGIQAAVYVAGGYKTPILEDFNSLFYVLSYFTGYTLQEGIPYWNTGRTYYIGSVVKKIATSELYMSLTDANSGNALPSKTDNAFWKYIIQRGILQYDTTYPYAVGELVQKPGTAEIYQSLIASNIGNALPAQSTTAIWKYCVDLANISTPATGVQKIKFGFASVTSTINANGVATVAKNPSGDFGFDSDMAVYAMVILSQHGMNINIGAASSFSYDYKVSAKLSGTGVDSNGGFLNGGVASGTYTLTLTVTTAATTGTGPEAFTATAVFIGIK